MEYFDRYHSPLGEMTMTSDGEALTALWFGGQKNVPEYPEGALMANQKLPVFLETRNWLDLYFSGRRPAATPPLHLSGTAFRMLIWELLLTIPYGQTTTYGEIAAKAAEKLGKKHMSAQAAGGAVGHNPVAIIVPCHRVIGADGSLTGYAGGLDKKTFLLELERKNG